MMIGRERCGQCHFRHCPPAEAPPLTHHASWLERDRPDRPSYTRLECGDNGRWIEVDLCPPEPPGRGETCEFEWQLCRYSDCSAGIDEVTTATCQACGGDAGAGKLCFMVNASRYEVDECMD